MVNQACEVTFSILLLVRNVVSLYRRSLTTKRFKKLPASHKAGREVAYVFENKTSRKRRFTFAGRGGWKKRMPLYNGEDNG
jgi:hypothetical protein